MKAQVKQFRPILIAQPLSKYTELEKLELEIALWEAFEQSPDAYLTVSFDSGVFQEDPRYKAIVFGMSSHWLRAGHVFDNPIEKEGLQERRYYLTDAGRQRFKERQSAIKEG